MTAEERTLKAIKAVRGLLGYALRNPEVIVRMAADDVEPDAIEDVVSEILCYLEKTAPEKPGEAEG